MTGADLALAPPAVAAAGPANSARSLLTSHLKSEQASALSAGALVQPSTMARAVAAAAVQFMWGAPLAWEYKDPSTYLRRLRRQTRWFPTGLGVHGWSRPHPRHPHPFRRPVPTRQPTPRHWCRRYLRR